MILEKFFIDKFSIKRDQVEALINEVETLVMNSSIEYVQKKALEEMELHIQANLYIEKEINEYREKLYTIAKVVAQSDLEQDIVTKSHAIRAKEMIWRKKVKWNYSDVILTIGGLCFGTGIPHLISLYQNSTIQVNIFLIILTVIGALLLGIGIVLKAKD